MFKRLLSLLGTSGKFPIIMAYINRSAFNKLGKIYDINKNEFYIYDGYSNQIIEFEYYNTNLTVNWKYKYYHNEIIYTKTFKSADRLSNDQEHAIANQIIYEANGLFESHRKRIDNVMGEKQLVEEVNVTKFETWLKDVEINDYDRNILLYIINYVMQSSFQKFTPEVVQYKDSVIATIIGNSNVANSKGFSNYSECIQALALKNNDFQIMLLLTCLNIISYPTCDLSNLQPANRTAFITLMDVRGMANMDEKLLKFAVHKLKEFE